REIIGLPPQWDEKIAEEKKYDRAERDRLEYVAVTRAKNALIVSTYREGSRQKAWELLYDLLQNAPKLKLPALIGQKEIESVDITVSGWRQTVKQIQEDVSNICRQSYSVTSVTSEAKEGYVFNAGTQAIGKGAQFGKIAHRAVELICRELFLKPGSGGPSNNTSKESEYITKPDKESHDLMVAGKVKNLAGKWLSDAGLSSQHEQQLCLIIDKFIASGLLKRISMSASRYFEVPFALGRDKEIMHGVIDLVFKENGSWIIVDYKTDDFEKDNERKKAYERQLEIYKEYWEKISGDKVSGTILYKLSG
ncbi:MAG: hypothetical protein FJW68_10175, partial [Actinobacteria bacterium]|nr:hypothetical protein [Actinomycetota bacterium]